MLGSLDFIYYEMDVWATMVGMAARLKNRRRDFRIRSKICHGVDLDASGMLLIVESGKYITQWKQRKREGDQKFQISLTMCQKCMIQ